MNCQSCGMPMNSPSEHTLGDEQKPYCVHCADANGNLKSKEEVREGMVNYYTQTEGKTREEAERVVDAHMSMQPAWQNPQPLSQTPVEPAEPVMAPETPVVPEPIQEPISPEPAMPEPVVSEPVVSESTIPAMPSTPVVEETAQVTPPVNQPVVENTNESNPTEVADNPESPVDNSGNGQV